MKCNFVATVKWSSGGEPYNTSEMEDDKLADFLLGSGEPGTLHLELHDNSGGEIEPPLDLIDLIRSSERQVTISAKGYLHSAAAVFYFYLKYPHPDDRENFENVRFCRLEECVEVLFHKLRILNGPFIAEESPPSQTIPANSEQRSGFVKMVFERFLAESGMSEEEAQAQKDVWGECKDCIFEWRDVP